MGRLPHPALIGEAVWLVHSVCKRVCLGGLENAVPATRSAICGYVCPTASVMFELLHTFFEEISSFLLCVEHVQQYPKKGAMPASRETRVQLSARCVYRLPVRSALPFALSFQPKVQEHACKAVKASWARCWMHLARLR